MVGFCGIIMFTYHTLVTRPSTAFSSSRSFTATSVDAFGNTARGNFTHTENSNNTFQSHDNRGPQDNYLYTKIQSYSENHTGKTAFYTNSYLTTTTTTAANPTNTSSSSTASSPLSNESFTAVTTYIGTVSRTFSSTTSTSTSFSRFSTNTTTFAPVTVSQQYIIPYIVASTIRGATVDTFSKIINHVATHFQLIDSILSYYTGFVFISIPSSTNIQTVTVITTSTDSSSTRISTQTLTNFTPVGRTLTSTSQLLIPSDGWGRRLSVLTTRTVYEDGWDSISFINEQLYTFSTSTNQNMGFENVTKLGAEASTNDIISTNYIPRTISVASFTQGHTSTRSSVAFTFIPFTVNLTSSSISSVTLLTTYAEFPFPTSSTLLASAIIYNTITENISTSTFSANLSFLNSAISTFTESVNNIWGNGTRFGSDSTQYSILYFLSTTETFIVLGGYINGLGSNSTSGFATAQTLDGSWLVRDASTFTDYTRHNNTFDTFFSFFGALLWDRYVINVLDRTIPVIVSRTTSNTTFIQNFGVTTTQISTYWGMVETHNTVMSYVFAIPAALQGYRPAYDAYQEDQIFSKISFTAPQFVSQQTFSRFLTLISTLTSTTFLTVGSESTSSITFPFISQNQQSTAWAFVTFPETSSFSSTHQSSLDYINFSSSNPNFRYVYFSNNQTIGVFQLVFTDKLSYSFFSNSVSISSSRRGVLFKSILSAGENYTLQPVLLPTRNVVFYTSDDRRVGNNLAPNIIETSTSYSIRFELFNPVSSYLGNEGFLYSTAFFGHKQPVSTGNASYLAILDPLRGRAVNFSTIYDLPASSSTILSEASKVFFIDDPGSPLIARVGDNNKLTAFESIRLVNVNSTVIGTIAFRGATITHAQTPTLTLTKYPY